MFDDDLSHEVSIHRDNVLHFPEEQVIIHCVGSPLSGHVSPKVKRNHSMLSEDGPDDELTYPLDEISSPWVVIHEIG